MAPDETDLDPELLERLRALPLEPGRPLLAVDCDEVLVHLSRHMARWLPSIGFRMELTRYQLEGSIFPAGSDDPVPFDDCLRLIDRFFTEQTLHQEPVAGAAEALSRLAAGAQVVVLTNVPGHAGEDRRKNLAGHGMGYPLVTNSGGKGRALAWLAARTAAPVAFVDDSLKQHESAARRAPGITRIHFVGAGELHRLLPESPAAHHRAADWTACEAAIRRALEL